MKPILVLSVFLASYGCLWSASAQYVDCQGETTYCYDACSGTEQAEVNADTCGYVYNEATGCEDAYGYCSNENGSVGCQGETVSCYDGCSGTEMTFTNSDTCSSTYNTTQDCEAAYAYCSTDAAEVAVAKLLKQRH